MCNCTSGNLEIPPSLRGAQATKQSSFFDLLQQSWIASLALAMTR
jgi:hypothetical protein